jgi:hypothetical protein
MSGKPNEYSDQLSPEVFAAVPKHVLAAIAVSALTFGGDYLSQAEGALLEEWRVLHEAGIVPQSVPARFLDRAHALEE